jgi:hypothetical protein
VKAPTLIVFVLVVVFSVFALLNWNAIVAPTALSVGFTTVHAPLGLILLTGSGLLTAAFLVFVAYQQTAALVESRRFARDLKAERELADKAEASRFTDLQTFLESELRLVNNELAAARADAHAHAGRLEEVLMTRLEEVGNGLSAHVAEVEDKLDRALGANAS